MFVIVLLETLFQAMFSITGENGTNENNRRKGTDSNKSPPGKILYHYIAVLCFNV